MALGPAAEQTSNVFGERQAATMVNCGTVLPACPLHLELGGTDIDVLLTNSLNIVGDEVDDKGVQQICVGGGQFMKRLPLALGELLE